MPAGVSIVLPDDYSSITTTYNGNTMFYTKTSRTITKCTHTWEESDSTEFTDYNECSKCGVYQEK